MMKENMKPFGCQKGGIHGPTKESVLASMKYRPFLGTGYKIDTLEEALDSLDEQQQEMIIYSI